MKQSNVAVLRCNLLTHETSRRNMNFIGAIEREGNKEAERAREKPRNEPGERG